MNLYVKNDYIKGLTGLQIGIMSVINYLSNKDEFYFSQAIIQDVLFGDVADDKRKVKYMCDTITYLIGNGYIRINKTIGQGKNAIYVCDSKSVYIDNEKDIYTYLSLDTVRNTANINVDMLKVLFAIGTSFNNETRVGYTSIDTFCEIYNIARATFIRHLQALEGNNILYVYHHKPTTDMNGDIKTPNNDYGEYSNRQMVDRVANEYILTFNAVNGHSKKQQSGLSDGRSIKQRYNSFVKGANYSEEQIKTLYDDCVRYNKYYEEKQKKDSSIRYEDKMVDMSVFDVKETQVVNNNILTLDNGLASYEEMCTRQEEEVCKSMYGDWTYMQEEVVYDELDRLFG